MAEQIKNNKKEVANLVQIKLEEPEQFNNIIATSTVASSGLEKKISELFGSTFSDFEGCKIMPIGDTLKCKLYFKPVMSKDDGLYAVKVRGEGVVKPNKNIGLTDVVNTVNMLHQAKRFELEDVAKEILAEFLVFGPNNAMLVDRYSPDLDKIVKVRLPKNWNEYTEEITDVVNNTRFQNPYLAITLDLVPIIAKLYGKKDQTEVEKLAGRGMPKDRYQYAVNVVKVLNPTMLQFILEIRRIDLNEMDRLSQSIGLGVPQGNIVMTRA